MNVTVSKEMCLNLAHHALGYVVMGVTLATVLMTFDGPIPMTNLLLAVSVIMVGWVMKTTNDTNAIERIAENQNGGTEELITTGWYQFTRNPCYLGQTIIIGGFLFIAPSLYGVGCFLVYFLAVNATVSIEEKRLAAQFGDEYVAYTKKVGRWYPLSLKPFLADRHAS